MTATPLERLRSADKVGILFSGGSARCIFQVGVVEQLYALGVRPAMVLGVSAGSWNAAAVAVGNWHRLRMYWRFFCRMPYIDLSNLLREHSPFIWTKLHARAFERYVGSEKLRATETPCLIALTRLRDRQQVIVDVRKDPEPFRFMLASNYLPPFYTHPLDIEGEQYGDGGWTNNIPYEALFEAGSDMVVMMVSKGESEGGLYRHPDDYNYEIPAAYRDRVVVIQPRHRMPLSFTERRWHVLRRFADIGALRAREVLLGEYHPETELAASGKPFSAYLVKVRDVFRRAAVWRRSRPTQPTA